MKTPLRIAMAGAVTWLVLGAGAGAETLSINQNTWLNYAIVVATVQKPSGVALDQHGTINGISSVQISGYDDAQLLTHQEGHRNTIVSYQSGWNAIGQIVQENNSGFRGHTNWPNTYWARNTDAGYLSYFMTGGFSLVTLTDPNHTWFSRFGRTR